MTPTSKCPAIRPPGGRVHPVYALTGFLTRVIGGILWRVEVFGAENVPKTGGCLLLTNHCSMLDPPIVGSWIRREMHSLGRDSLFKLPVFAWWIRKLNSHPLRREGIDREAIKYSGALVKAGYPLLLFPEGTRSPDGRLQPSKGGFGMILEAVPHAPCIPILLSGTDRALGRGMIIPRPAKVTITVGKPFVIGERHQDESRRDYYQRCADSMDAAWKAMLKESSGR